MSLPPELEQKLDGWLLGLRFAINGSKKRNVLHQRADESDLQFQARLFTTPAPPQEPNEFGLEELSEILGKILNEPGVDANELFGLSKGRGGQPVDQDRQRLWTIFLCWMAAVREQDPKPGVAKYVSYLSGVGIPGMVVSDKSLESKWQNFKAAGGTDFILYGGLRSLYEEKMVAHLERQSEAMGLRLWAPWALDISTANEEPYSFRWSLEKPDEGWYEASLQWTERDSEEDQLY